jgi:hypothetical protein
VRKHEIDTGMRDGITSLPGVVAGQTHAVKTAQRPHRIRFLEVLDEGKDVLFRAEVNAMAFFRMSCSSFRRS